MDEQTIVGIDLGTTNSVVSVLDENTPKTLKIDNQKLLPSVVCYSNDGVIVGQVAKNMAILEPENTVLSIKRKMGQDTKISLGEKSLRPEEIAALILKKIRNAVTSQFGLDI
ncbi:MAG: Hsp70 family protein, partial [Bacteroidales bacterium]|nr:Hsp70 family protein [Bacteroidales bacterium]